MEPSDTIVLPKAVTEFSSVAQLKVIRVPYAGCQMVNSSQPFIT